MHLFAGDLIGPPVICLVLFVAVLVNFVIRGELERSHVGAAWFDLPTSLSSTRAQLQSYQLNGVLRWFFSPYWCYHLTQYCSIGSPPCLFAIVHSNRIIIHLIT